MTDSRSLRQRQAELEIGRVLSPDEIAVQRCLEAYKEVDETHWWCPVYEMYRHYRHQFARWDWRGLDWEPAPMGVYEFGRVLNLLFPNSRTCLRRAGGKPTVGREGVRGPGEVWSPMWYTGRPKR